MKLFWRIVQEIQNVVYALRAQFGEIKDVVDHDVPYVCQFAKPESAELSLTKKLTPVNDPHWKETGALSPERYAQWAFTMCGMASVAMALGHFTNKDVLVAGLAEDALSGGVYVDEDGVISSMKYRVCSVD